MNFPKNIWLVRHGESLANVARHQAESNQHLTIKFAEREQDVPLSDLGKIQSKKLHTYFAEISEKPSVIFSSPYERTRQTTDLIELKDSKIIYDERLRERELGIFDRLTKLGAMQKFPDECKKREQLGKFYYRPIGGENWADVVLRLRSFWRDLRLNFADEKVLIVTHEVVIRCFRYILEDLTEAEILAIDCASDVANGAITSYNFNAENQKLSLDLDNFLP
ncbi:MAG: histidine phosphatase family protein [Pyrinomonadaceae bacterium]|nr:histidine phosphatase family protein [Pyrinomonadaceae bacterium]